MGIQVNPKPDSYVLDWEAVQICGADCFGPVRKLLSGSPWVGQLVLERDDTIQIVITSTANGLQQWTLGVGEWVVKSPHGRYWFMSDSEFHSQFWGESS